MEYEHYYEHYLLLGISTSENIMYLVYHLSIFAQHYAALHLLVQLSGDMVLGALGLSLDKPMIPFWKGQEMYVGFLMRT